MNHAIASSNIGTNHLRHCHRKVALTRLKYIFLLADSDCCLLNIGLGLKITDCKINWYLEGSVMIISSLWIFEIQSSYSRHVPI